MTETIPTPASTEAPKAKAKAKKSESAKPTQTKSEKNRLRKPQAAILEVLAKAKGPMTRTQVAERAGYKSAVGIRAEIGWPDLDCRKNYDKNVLPTPCLLTMGWAKELTLDIDGRKEHVIQITPAGRKALEKHNKG